MTHKESEEFSKHNDDVEIVVGKTGVRPCEREKRGQKGKRCVGTRMLVTRLELCGGRRPGRGAGLDSNESAGNGDQWAA